MRICITTPVRQDEGIFIEYMKSLNELKVAEGVTVDKFFIFHNSEHLIKHLSPNDKYEIYNDTDNDYICDEQSHHWNNKNLSTMSTLRNKCIQYVIDYDYDYYFLVDSDLILHRDTLQNLLNAQKDLVANIFWTQTTPGTNSYWANCWMYDQCGLEQEHIMQWFKPGIYEVGGTGACFLVSRKVLIAGVNYDPIHNIKAFHGEDRFFCIRAVVHGFDIYIDTHLPALHLYRKSDYEQYMKRKYGGGINGTT